MLEEDSSLQSSFVIHPRIKIREPGLQGYGLTGSREVEPPKRFLDFSETLDVTPWKRLIEKALIFEKEFEARTVDSIHHKIPHLSFIQNVIKLLFSQAASHPSLTDLHFHGECHVKSSWLCVDNRIDVRGRPGILVKSKKPFQSFFGTEPVAMDDTMTDQHFDYDDDKLFTKLNKWNVHKELPPLNNSIKLFPNNHTLVMFCRNESAYPAIIDKSLIYLHALATRQALNRNKKGNLLNPECVQGIITDGKHYTFLWYQLNSCYDDVASSGTISNNVAIVRQQPLFHDVIQTTRRNDYSSWKLSYNESMLKKLLSLFLWQ